LVGNSIFRGIGSGRGLLIRCAHRVEVSDAMQFRAITIKRHTIVVRRDAITQAQLDAGITERCMRFSRQFIVWPALKD
jgi:hypothetical protein